MIKSFFLSALVLFASFNACYSTEIVKTPIDYEDFPLNWHILSPQSNPETPMKIHFFHHISSDTIKDLEREMVEISEPTHPRYTSYLTHDEVNHRLLDISTHDQIISEYEQWFNTMEMEVSFENVCSDRWDHITCDLTSKQVENLFDTRIYKFYRWNLDQDLRFHNIAGYSYSVPKSVHETQDFILGLVDFPENNEITAKSYPISDTDHLKNVDENYVITYESLHNLYNITDVPDGDVGNSQAVIEFQDDACFSYQDMVNFTGDSGIPLPRLSTVGTCNTNTTGPDTEGSLDIQYQYATGPIGNSTRQIYVVVENWLLEFAEELYNMTNEEAPLVSSMSWGWWENGQVQIIKKQSEKYVFRCNLAFLKNSLLGRTLVASSGDSGSSGRTNGQCSEKPYLRAVYPTSSPWVLSVGGNIYTGKIDSGGKTPICKKFNCVMHSEDEQNCEFGNDCGWCSGSGIASFSERQDWTVFPVQDYLNQRNRSYYLPPAEEYFKYGRAYPDISIQAHNYLVTVGGAYMNVDGTSCSSPAVSGMISRINQWLLSNDRKPVGLVAPLLYHIKNECDNCFHKPTTGCSNSTESGECPPYAGFCASDQETTYDTVYGLGLPNFGNILEFVKNM
jgi:tripeptidyl-peptidase I